MSKKKSNKRNKRNKKNSQYRGNIIFIIVIALIISGAVVFFKTDFFRTKRSAFFRYFNQIPTVTEILETDKFDSYYEKKMESPYVRSAEMTIQSSSNIADSSILDNIKFKLNERVDRKNERGSADLVISRKDEQLIKITGIRNKDSFGVLSEDIVNGFIAVNNSDLKRIAKDWGAESTQMFPDVVRDVKISSILDTSKNEKNHISACVNLIKNNVPNTSYSKEGKKKIKINDKSYVTNSYKLSLNSNSCASLKIDILEKISKDSILMDYFASKAKLLNFDEEYTSVNSLNNVIKNRISEIKANPSIAGDLEITVYEYKQKNVRCEIKNGDNTICIEHVNENNDEYSSIVYNDNRYSVEYDGSKYYFGYEDTSDENNKKNTKIEFSQSGSVENNDIKNNMTITSNSGVKSITYVYSDTVDFTEDIGSIADYGTKSVAILNNYKDDELKEFFENLRTKINEVYVKKGSLIGVNLDPIFD